jgi:hypothetical protein
MDFSTSGPGVAGRVLNSPSFVNEKEAWQGGVGVNDGVCVLVNIMTRVSHLFICRQGEPHSNMLTVITQCGVFKLSPVRLNSNDTLTPAGHPSATCWNDVTVWFQAVV